jgi:gliding motility-associated-like protein
MKHRLVYIFGIFMLICTGNSRGYAQTTVFYDNCNALGGWTNTGKIYPANVPGYNFLAVIPTVPAGDHTGGGGVFYTNGNSVYSQAGAGSYIQYQLVSPVVNLTGYDNCRLEFWMQMRSEVGNWDGGYVEVSNNGGTSWTKLTAANLCIPFDGNMSLNPSSTPYYYLTTPCWFQPKLTWTRVVANISAFDNVANFKMRYTFHSDEAVSDLGWALDDIKIVSIAQPEVRGNGIVIPDNDITPILADNTDFGNVGVGQSLVKTFFIHNIGEAPLTLTGVPYVTTTGTGFSIVSQPATNIIPAGGSVSFDVQFAPLVTGLINGTINIPNSDIYSSCSPPNPYNYSIKANGVIINTPPFITNPPADTTVCPNTAPINIPFTVGDNQQAPGALTLSGTSSNPAVITNANIVFGGAGANRDVTLTPVPGAVGSSTITITVNDGQVTNFDSTFSFVLTLQDNVNPTAVCQNVQIQLDPLGNGSLTAAQADNGSFDNCGISSTSISQTAFTCADVGLQLLDFTVTDIVGNSSVCQFTANVLPAPMINNFTTSSYNGFEVSCFGGNNGSIQIQTSGGCTPYTYAGSYDPANNTNTAASLPAGNYTVTITDAAGQQEIIPIVLTQPTALVNNSTSIDISCFGKVDGSINLNIAGGISPYVYSQGPQLNNVPAGNYHFIVTDNNNCNIPVDITIVEPAAITITGVNEYFMYCGEEVVLNVDVAGGSGGFVYNWSNGAYLDCATCEDPIASPDQSTIFTIEATDIRGCNEFYSITAEVDCNVFIPNSFTPNLDELNQFFTVHVSNVQFFEMRIHDRWGEEIFSSQDKDHGWNGNVHDGTPAPVGVYVYDVYIIMPNGKEISLRGMVNLLR